jgi:hypothetical protein
LSAGYEVFVYFNCDFRTCVDELSDDPSAFLTEYAGELFVVDEDGEKRELAGKARIFVLNADAAERADTPLFDVLDYRAETAPYIELLNLQEAGNFSPAVCKLLAEEMVMSQNMLILDRLEVLPEFRGEKLALRFMQAVIHRFAMGCRIVALKAYPLQFEASESDQNSDGWRSRLSLESLSSSEKVATAKLKSYYAREGFVSVKGTSLMILDLDQREHSSGLGSRRTNHISETE